MSSDSGKKCSIDELKRLNQPQELTPPTPACPTQEQWTQMVSILNAQYRLLKAMSSTLGTAATQAERLTKEVEELRQQLQQVGKKKERRPSLPKIHLPTPSPAWLWAIPILVALLVIWFAGATIWNNLLHPFLQLLQ